MCASCDQDGTLRAWVLNRHDIRRYRKLRGWNGSEGFGAPFCLCSAMNTTAPPFFRPRLARKVSKHIH